VCLYVCVSFFFFFQKRLWRILKNLNFFLACGVETLNKKIEFLSHNNKRNEEEEEEEEEEG